MEHLVDQINALLPQTQCQRCDFPDCKSYAKAIAGGQNHNQCPPGGPELITQLSKLLDRKEMDLNPQNGAYGPETVVEIEEDKCIGCTKCILACPVDAIIGAQRVMHTVNSHDCTGCNLCIEPCPMDCIIIKERSPTLAKRKSLANFFKTRFEKRRKRLHLDQEQKLLKQAKLKRPLFKDVSDPKQAKQQYIKDAIKRAAEKKRGSDA